MNAPALHIPEKKKEKIRVLAFGTFDIIHPGHIDFLKNAKNLGDELFVIVALDATVEKRKKKPPRFSETMRRNHVETLGIADHVSLGRPTDYLSLPRIIDPDVIALGYDQEAPMELLRNNFPNAKITRLLPHFAEEFKSSKLRNIFPDPLYPPR